MKYYVYAYLHPLTLDPFYIGKGCGNRAWRHLSEKREKAENYKRWCFIEGLRRKSLEPYVAILASSMSEDSAYELEARLIKHYGRTNIDDGGILTNICEDLRPPSPKGKPAHPSHRERMRKDNPGKKHWEANPYPKELKDRIAELLKGESNPMFGRSHFDIWVEKYGLEEANKRESIRRQRMSKANTGKRHSIESRKRMSVVQKGRIITDEHRAIISKNMSGRVAVKNTALGISKTIVQGELETYLDDGWIRGRYMRKGWKKRK